MHTFSYAIIFSALKTSTSLIVVSMLNVLTTPDHSSLCATPSTSTAGRVNKCQVMRAPHCVIRALLTSSQGENTIGMIFPAGITAVLSAWVHELDNLDLPRQEAMMNLLVLIPHHWANWKYAAWIKGFSSSQPPILNHFFFYDHHVS